MILSHRTRMVLAAALLVLPALASEQARPAEDKATRPAPTLQPPEWPIYRGDPARSNRGESGTPVLQALWCQSLFDEEENTPALEEHLRSVEKKLQRKHEPIIPAFSPISLTVFNHKGEKKPLLLFKNFRGIVAIDRNNGHLLWKSPSSWSLQYMVSFRGAKALAVSNWFLDYEKQSPQILFENSTTGTLSTDGQFVYVVEDLAVPPLKIHRGQVYNPPSRDSNPYTLGCTPITLSSNPPILRKIQAVEPLFSYRVETYDAETEDAVRHNRLYALNLSRSGALSWALGEDEEDPLHDCYFLGPPLPLDGRLYVLIQKKQQISLLSIDPPSNNQRPAQPKIVFMKPLAETATSLIEDPIRRTQAAHVAYGQGILVCPTNAGTVFGVDRLKQRIAWVYRYRERDKKTKDRPAPAAINSNRWKTTAPVISDGTVVFTPPDDPSIHCLSLTDGSLLWSRKKSSNDVYLGGVYGGKVLLIGAKSARALKLANGETLWTRDTGLPSGQGIAAEDLYYLPLRHGTQSKQPEVCVLDLAKGEVIAHHKMPRRKPQSDDFDVPGNLLFIEGKLISQSAWEIVAYPTRGGK